MKTKFKLYGPIILLALIFYMMLSTPHSRALGDIVLESIGMKSWTDGYTGTHLAVIYFGILFFIVFNVYSWYVNDDVKKNRLNKILLFIGSVTIIYLAHSTFVHMAVGNAEGLNTIAIAPSGNFYDYKIADGEIQEFEYEFELTNYSRDSKNFSINGYLNNMIRFEVLDKNGTMAKFNIREKGNVTYNINNENFIIKVYGIDKQFSAGGRGIIDSLILLDEESNPTKVIKLRDRGIEK
ncbi:MAG: hypothetical protein EWM47_09370 [Anaerolineaceae bacterium]|nr:MAG: hypothetical protein EWM47_09370 [Anaerolineaceae bacterium]